MPTPLDILLDPLTWAVLAMFAALGAWERLRPAKPLPPVRGWTPRAIGSTVIYLSLSTYLPLLWSEPLGGLQLFDLGDWPTWAAALAGVLGYELAAYVYHRAMHAWSPLWLSLHQMHHSAERLDTTSAFWFSPLDMVGWTLLSSVALTLLGVPAPAATVALLVITFLGIFQHANVRTPAWLGYFVQRPESHSLHHARGVHRYNYADLPVFDLLFGTFRNPRVHAAENGFWNGASARIVAMLTFRDVSEAPRTSSGRSPA
jgi:sterol desaturase/sphingolipid hydroxylase (fatty acid hydroxylase superfamily)